MKLLQNITYINFLQVVLSASLRIFLPLYLLTKNFKIEEIGLLFAILPLVMMVVRAIFASIADIIGTKLIFRIYGLSVVSALVTYLFANNSVLFGLGKALEGVRQSGFWAVNRTELYRSVEKGKEEKFASFMLGVRFLGDVAGQILIALFLTYLAFSNTLLALILISLVLLYFTFKINSQQDGKINPNLVLKQIFQKRDRKFWSVSIIMSIAAIYEIGMYTGFVLPIYFSTVLNMNPLEIGLAFALYSLFYAIGTLSSVKFHIPLKINAILSVVLVSIPLIFFIYLDKFALYPMLALIALGAGFGGHLYESAFAKLTRKSSLVSTDIGVSVVPYRIIEIISLASFGFLIVSFGYGLIFSLVSISVFLMTLFIYPYLKNNSPN
ncbi:MFS transporter [Candidatus Micrarchaeota archaeon]|nr:MFS transporter [Candidatus Micrarchaeota archaeon]